MKMNVNLRVKGGAREGKLATNVHCSWTMQHRQIRKMESMRQSKQLHNNAEEVWRIKTSETTTNSNKFGMSRYLHITRQTCQSTGIAIIAKQHEAIVWNCSIFIYFDFMRAFCCWCRSFNVFGFRSDKGDWNAFLLLLSLACNFYNPIDFYMLSFTEHLSLSVRNSYTVAGIRAFVALCTFGVKNALQK